MSTIRFYCTYFDRNYTAKALTLFESLKKHEDCNIKIFAICHDEISRLVLNKLNLDYVCPVPIHDIEFGDEALLNAKKDRTFVEYYWTTTPTVILRTLERNPEIDYLTYVDADLCFYSSPQPIFDEFNQGNGDVLIHEHRYSPSMAHLCSGSGKYNVGLLIFKNNQNALHVLNWWRDRCIEWCYFRFEDGKIGDQAYLNDWTTRFKNIVVLQHIGAGVAPWNHDQYQLSYKNSLTYVDEFPLIFYHYHAFEYLQDGVFVPAKHDHYVMNENIVNAFFISYANKLSKSYQLLNKIFGFEFDYGKVGLSILDSVSYFSTNYLQRQTDFILHEESLLDSKYLWQRSYTQLDKYRYYPKLTHQDAIRLKKIISTQNGLLPVIEQLQISTKLKTIAFIGCHYFEERQWFLNVFPNLENLYLFEPIPEIYASLHQEFKLHPKIKVFPFAISDFDGVANFRITNNLQSSSLLALKEHKTLFPYVNEARNVEVQVRKFDSVLNEFNLNLPDLLYIDVQGAEYHLIKSLSKDVLEEAKLIYTEASLTELYEGTKPLSELRKLLASNFEFLGFKDMLNSKVHGDALFINHDFKNQLLDNWTLAKRLNTQAEQLFNSGQSIQAIQLIDRAIKLDIENVEIYSNLAVMLWNSNAQTDAINIIKQAIRINPFNQNLVINAWYILKSINQIELAENLKATYLKVFSNDSLVMNLK